MGNSSCKPKLSYTQISMFEECPKKWHYCYVQNKWSSKNWPVLFGGDVHDCIAEALVSSSAEKVVKQCSFSYLDDPKFGMLTAMKLTEIALRMFDSLNFKEFWIEQEISTDSFLGIIDLYGNTPYGTYIIDWKTTSQEYTEHDVIASDQLTAYAYLYHHKTGELPDYVCFATLNRGGYGTLFKSTRNAKDLTYWAKKVVSVQSEIAHNVDRKNPNVCMGRWGKCYFYNLCWPERKWEVVSEELPKLTCS